MQGLRSVLAIVDTRKEQSRALKKAYKICKATGAQLHVLAPNPRIDQTPTNRLQEFVDSQIDSDVDIYLHELWKGSVIESIIHVREMERCELVVKAAKLIRRLQAAFSTPEDWSLLRRCKVPILLVQTVEDWRGQPILAAINADPRDHFHSVLNQAILGYASQFAALFETPLHIASAYPTTMLAIQDHGDGQLDKDFYELQCRHYAQNFPIAEDGTHLSPGPTEKLIPRVLDEIGAQLLVLGTHARTGISAIAIGNTAEQLIHRVTTDILVLQPKDHMQPLERVLGRF